MDFTLNEVQQLLQDSVRRFIVNTYDFDKRKSMLERADMEPEAGWRLFADNGWLAASVPEAYGGLGGSVVETVLIAHELGRGLALEPYLGCAVLGPQTLLACPASARRDALLPGLMDGSRRLALAYAEPQSYGIPLPPTTQARRVAQGYRLDGVKTLVLGGQSADFFLVTAKIELSAEQGGTALFLLPADAPGLTRRALPLHDDTCAAELTLQGVTVAQDMLVCSPHEGMARLLDGLAYGTAALCSELIGVMEKAIEITAEYLKIRKQFGVAIGSFQALQHRMADMAAEMELARSMLYALLSAITSADIQDRQLIVSQAKALIGRAAKTVCGQAIQLHGGVGMTHEYAVGHYYKRALVADILLGSSERHDAFCADASFVRHEA